MKSKKNYEERDYKSHLQSHNLEITGIHLHFGFMKVKTGVAWGMGVGWSGSSRPGFAIRKKNIQGVDIHLYL